MEPAKKGEERATATYLNDTLVFGMARALKSHVRNLSSLSDNEHFHDLRHLTTGENGCVHQLPVLWKKCNKLVSIIELKTSSHATQTFEIGSTD
jgi:hypothetical protein